MLAGAREFELERTMEFLTLRELRMFFMREGKLAGSVADWAVEGEPKIVKMHLELLTTELRDDLAAVTEDEQTSLFGVFIAAARKCKSGALVEAGLRDLEISEVLRRISGLDGVSRNERIQDFANREKEKNKRAARKAAMNLATRRWTREQAALASREEYRAHASTRAIEFVERTNTNRDESVSFDDLLHLHRELGRLAGPLHALEEDSGAGAVSQAIRVITVAYVQRMTEERRFDNSGAKFITLTWSDVSTEFQANMLEQVELARDQYLEDFPLGTPLPLGDDERREEEERRAAQRLIAIQRARLAIEELVAPLTERWLLLTAALAERDQKLRSKRAETGFAAPVAQPYGVSPRGAELWVADAMRSLGAHDATVTQQSQDGGVDVVTSRFAVSVKHYAGAVPVEEIREIFGVAITLNKTPVLWTSGSLTKAAFEFAELGPVAVIQYKVEEATWVGLNATGQGLIDEGAGPVL
ncbi:restriction endonuclease [Salinibacterium amurskyense]|nr:restriction endonuclease [Salinibacterium amurskyense]